MKPNAITRRAMLSAAMSIVASSSIAQEPASKPDAIKSLIPITTRSIELPPLARTISRTVVTAISADPRGKFVVAAGDDHAIRVLDADTLQLMKTLQGHRDLVRTLSFDREGEKLVSAGNDGQLIIWDRDDDFRVLQKMSGTPALACVRFSPDGKEIAAVGFDRRVYLIGRGPQTYPTFQCDCNDLRAVAYRADNEVLAVAGRSGALHLFDLETGQLRGEFDLHRARINALEFQPNANTIVSVADDGAVVVFDTRQKTTVQKIQVTTGKLFAIAVLDSRTIAVAGSDNVIRVVNTDNGSVVRELTGHHGSIRSLTADGNTLFSGGFDATLRRWSLAGIQDQARIADGNQGNDRQ